MFKMSKFYAIYFMTNNMLQVCYKICTDASKGVVSNHDAFSFFRSIWTQKPSDTHGCHRQQHLKRQHDGFQIQSNKLR